MFLLHLSLSLELLNYINKPCVLCYRCLIENTSIALQVGVVCDAHRIEARDCSQYQTCSECLARWPAFPSISQVGVPCVIST